MAIAIWTLLGAVTLGLLPASVNATAARADDAMATVRAVGALWSTMLVVFSLGCGAATPAIEKRVMTDLGPSKTVCAGRLLIDVPQATKVRLVSTYHSADTKRIGSARNFNDIKSDLQKRADLLERQKMRRDEGGDRLARRFGKNPETEYSSTRLIGLDFYADSSQAVLGYHKDSSSPEIDAELHSYILGNHFVVSNSNVGAAKYPLIRDNLIRIASHLSPLKPDEVPKQSGFCFDGGIFADQGRPEANETFTLALEFPQHADVRFSIESIAIDAPDNEESLEQRAQADLASMRSQVGQVDVISRGKESVAGQPGYEIAISAPTESGNLRKFFWSAEGVPNDVTRPFLEVDMMIEPTDGHPATFKSDAEAKAFWDSLLNSLRVRPGAA